MTSQTHTRGSRERPEAEGAAVDAVPLLLHSIDSFGDLPVRAIELSKPRRIVEIGAEGGLFTRALVEYGDAHDAEILCVDPAPTADLRRLAETTRLELVEGYSPAALDDTAPCDVYVVDGDHNFHTVHGELEAIHRLNPDALVILHDVAWPCARRDFYYGPEHLPADAVHPHSFHRAAVPGREELADRGGLSGAGNMAIAERTGGERNGVLTAVEDFIAAREGYEFARVPCVYGLGFLFPADAPWAADVRALLAPFDENELLATLEANRLKLYFHVVELQDEVEHRLAGFDRALTAAEARVEELTAENLRLQREARA